MSEFTTREREHHFGVASVLEAVEGEHFPVSREKLLLDRGDREVEVRPGVRRKLRDLLEPCRECEEFSSAEDLISQIEDELVLS